MEEISLKEMFDYFMSKKMYIIIITLIAVFIGGIYGLLIKKPMYNSYTTIVLATTNENSSANNQGITQSDITLNQNLVSTYREIIKSRRILNQVINNLNLNYSISQLQQLVTVSSEKDTELIRISVNANNPELAKNIANEIEKVFSNEIVNIYNIKNVSIIDYAEVNNNPYNINKLKELFLSFAVGLVLSSGLVFVIYYFDTTIKNTEEIENKIGLPTLGVVPLKITGKGGKKR